MWTGPGSALVRDGEGKTKRARPTGTRTAADQVKHIKKGANMMLPGGGDDSIRRHRKRGRGSMVGTDRAVRAKRGVPEGTDSYEGLLD